MGVTGAEPLRELLDEVAQIIVSFVRRNRLHEERAQGIRQELVFEMLQFDNLIEYVWSVMDPQCIMLTPSRT